VALGEGLRALDVPFYSSVNYWPLEEARTGFLFTSSPDVRPEDCDIVVVSHAWFDDGDAMPSALFTRSRKYVTVYMDCSDGIYTHGFRRAFRKFDIIFKVHFNRCVTGYPSNMQPWAFGLTRRIMDATANAGRWSERKRVFLSNFRVEHPIRSKAKERCYPLLERLFRVVDSNDGFAAPADRFARVEWDKTGRRHNPAYYEALTGAQAVSCFAGYYFVPFLRPVMCARIANRIIPERGKVIHQWDTFRLWEAFCAGCLVCHVDFEKYGLQLPVMPQNLTHYLGFDLDDRSASEAILDNSWERLATIAESGRAWAMEHYSPVAVAQRFLRIAGCSSGA